MKKITLLVTGSIAAYKSAELVRTLTKQGFEVQVAMSQGAQQFITPLTLQTLSKKPVMTDLLKAEEEHVIGHIKLADEADLILVAPASANIIAKAALGIADDAPSTILLATKAPVVFAPAMNVNMWEHLATQENVNKLKARGVHFIEPEVGDLACGWYGQGRFAEIESIINHLAVMLETDRIYQGTEVIVTAGPTIEAIDPIRHLTNGSSGQMGYALAMQAKMLGAKVTLISGPTALEQPSGINFIRVNSALDMHKAVDRALAQPMAAKGQRFLFMSAAVSDHRPAQYSETKLKFSKNSTYSVEMIPNPDILQSIGHKRNEYQELGFCTLKLIGFAAETGDHSNLMHSAQCKLDNKKLDLIVANFADEGLGTDSNHVWLIDPAGRIEELPQASKANIALGILKRAREL